MRFKLIENSLFFSLMVQLTITRYCSGNDLVAIRWQAITWTNVNQISWHHLNWVNIGSVNGLVPVRRQAITWTNAGLLPIGPLRTNSSEILIVKFRHFHSRKCYWKCRLRNGGHLVQGVMSLFVIPRRKKRLSRVPGMTSLTCSRKNGSTMAIVLNTHSVGGKIETTQTCFSSGTTHYSGFTLLSIMASHIKATSTLGITGSQ